MKTIIIILPFLIKLSLAQHSILVLEKQTNIPLYTVNVALLKKDIGTTTNENGVALLNINKNDSILITLVGYIAIRGTIVNTNSDTFFLEKKIIANDNITVKAKKYINTKQLGFTKGIAKDKLSLTGNGYTTAVFIENTEKLNGILKSVKLQLEVPKSKINSSLRIRIFEADESKTPQEELTYENVLIKYSELKRNTIIDLEKYNLPITKFGIFIGIELISINDDIRPTITLKCIRTNENDNNWSNFKDKKWVKYYPKNFEYISTPKISIKVKY